jgi:signal transduction histidine kinase/CheY-like chemotaxis protein
VNADLSKNAADQQVLVEQVKAQYRTLPPVLLMNLIVSSALLYVLWREVAHSTLLTWWFLLQLMSIIRTGNYYFSYRRAFTPSKVGRYASYLIIGSAVSGVLWGASGILFFPTHELDYQIFILALLVGMGAGALSSLTTYLPAFLAYFPISLLPIGMKFLSVGEPIHLTIGLLTMIFVFALIYFGVNINRTIRNALTLRFENLALVEQLSEQKEAAEIANIAKSKFLAVASHDLRQPLHALTLFTSILDESIKYPQVRLVVDKIQASVSSLQSLFNALLDISRLDAGAMQVEKTHFLVQPMLESLANEYDLLAQEKSLRIVWPDCPHGVYTDQTLLEQILRNFISNAIRYTKCGEIRVTCEATSNELRFSITDSGIGIPADQIEAIFTEFYQLENPERDRVKGLGLGLAIVQRTARLLGHVIDVKSQPGQGSTFSITVPQSAPIASTCVVGNIETADDIVADVMFIVIDDEINIREGTQNLLALWGYKVITASDKDDALSKLRQQDLVPTGIIADYRLPEGQTGIDVIKAIHAEYAKDIPALIVTGDIAEDRLRAVAASGIQMLHKPVLPAKLRAFLRHARTQNA